MRNKIDQFPEYIQRQIAKAFDEDRTSDSITDLEQTTCLQPMGQKEDQRFTSPVRIHIHSIRKRLADPDGISGKAVLDGLVKAKVLKSDSAKEITSVTFSQEKLDKEETVIFIYEDLGK